MHPVGNRTYGYAMVAGGAVLWSTAGLFVRSLDLDVWTMLAWRQLFSGISLGLFVLLRNRKPIGSKLRQIGWPGLGAIPLAALNMACYVIALKLTSVANVMIVFATLPFVAAAIACLWIGERPGKSTLFASTVALAGVVLMVGSASGTQDILGNAFAFLMTLAFAIQLVMTRRYPGLEMPAINAFGAMLCAAAVWAFASATIPDPQQLAILALFGVTTTALAYGLFLEGAKHLPSAEAGLIGLLDVVLSPLWVWLVFAEDPGTATIVGGTIVLAAVIFHLAGSLRGA